MEPVRPRRRGGVVGPLILIFLGAVFLLQNTGYLPPNFWVNLWRLWPLILVLIGIELLLAHRVPWAALAAVAAVVLVVGAVAINTNMPAFGEGPSIPGVSRSFRTDLQGANQAAITIHYGAGQLNVGPLSDAQPNELSNMTYQGPPQFVPEPHYTATPGGVGQLDYSVGGRPGPNGWPFGGPNNGSSEMDLNLAPSVPIASLNVQTGATDARLDLSQLRVTTLDLSIGAATTWVRMPTSGLTTAHISGGASTITVEIPQGVAAQIQHGGGLSTLRVDETRFPQASDSVYRSPDYDTAANKVDLTIETGVTSIAIN